MTLKKYNMLQIQRIKNFAMISHESCDKVAVEWVEKYSKDFSNKIKKLGISVFR